MFLGHYGVAFALKRAEPKLSLGTLFLAVQLPDLLWGIFRAARLGAAPGSSRGTPPSHRSSFWTIPSPTASSERSPGASWRRRSITRGPPATPAVTGRLPRSWGSRCSPTIRSTFWFTWPTCRSGQRLDQAGARSVEQSDGHPGSRGSRVRRRAGAVRRAGLPPAPGQDAEDPRRRSGPGRHVPGEHLSGPLPPSMTIVAVSDIVFMLAIACTGRRGPIGGPAPRSSPPEGCLTR